MIRLRNDISKKGREMLGRSQTQPDEQLSATIWAISRLRAADNPWPRWKQMRGGGWRLPTATCFSDWHDLNYPTLVSYTDSEGDLENCNHFHKVSCSKQYVSYSLSLPLYRSHLYYKQRPPTLLSKDHISLSQKFEALRGGQEEEKRIRRESLAGFPSR